MTPAMEAGWDGPHLTICELLTNDGQQTASPMSNGRVEFKRLELQQLVNEAKSLGLDTDALIAKAQKRYQLMKRNKFNQPSMNVRSELDYSIRVVGEAIRKKRDD